MSRAGAYRPERPAARLRPGRRVGGVFVVRRHEIDYLAQVTAGQTLVAQTWVDEWKGASCVRRIEKSLNKVGGVQEASVNLATEKAHVVFDPTLVTFESMKAAVEKAGYGVGELPSTSAEDPAPTPEVAERFRVLAGRRSHLAQHQLAIGAPAVPTRSLPTSGPTAVSSASISSTIASIVDGSRRSVAARSSPHRSFSRSNGSTAPDRLRTTSPTVSARS